MLDLPIMLILDLGATVSCSCKTEGGMKLDIVLQRLINVLHTHLNALFELLDGFLEKRMNEKEVRIDVLNIWSGLLTLSS